MIINKLKNLFYCIQTSFIFNLLFGLSFLYVIWFWLPDWAIEEYLSLTGLITLGIPFFVGILPALSYNLIRFRMVKSGELNYGICRYTLSTVLPFIAPMLIYGIAYLNGFRLN